LRAMTPVSLEKIRIPKSGKVSHGTIERKSKQKTRLTTARDKDQIMMTAPGADAKNIQQWALIHPFFELFSYYATHTLPGNYSKSRAIQDFQETHRVFYLVCMSSDYALIFVASLTILLLTLRGLGIVKF
jgi:hypothetical protein